MPRDDAPLGDGGLAVDGVVDLARAIVEVDAQCELHDATVSTRFTVVTTAETYVREVYALWEAPEDRGLTAEAFGSTYVRLATLRGLLQAAGWRGFANIDLKFAQHQVAEFVLFWRDSNQVHASWNTRFLQFVKQRWAKRHSEGDPQSKSTRDLTLAEQLTDRSWAL